MNKDLPNVYANRIDKVFNNDQDVFYSGFNNSRNDVRNINKKINDIFSSSNFVYKKDVKIYTSNGIINKTIVGINGNNLLTMDNESININEIQNIEVK